MLKAKRTAFLSILLIMSLVIGAIGIANVDTSFAATKKIHLKKVTVSVSVGKTYQQKLIDKKGKTIKASKVKWKSKKTSVAKINKKGKVTAIKAGTAKMTAKYKGKTYKFTVKVTKSSNQYTMGDKLNLLDYLGSAMDYGDYLSEDTGNWRDDNYRSYSNSLDSMKNDAKEISRWAVKAKKITSQRSNRYCKSEKAAERGFTTWDQMIGTIQENSDYIANADVSSMSEMQKRGFAGKAYNLIIDINTAYIEVYDY